MHWPTEADTAARAHADTSETISGRLDTGGDTTTAAAVEAVALQDSSWHARIGCRISYRNPLPELLPEPALEATIDGVPLAIPHLDRSLLPVRPYRTLTAGAVALIDPADIHTIHGPTTGKHHTHETPEQHLREGTLWAAAQAPRRAAVESEQERVTSVPVSHAAEW